MPLPLCAKLRSDWATVRKWRDWQWGVSAGTIVHGQHYLMHFSKFQMPCDGRAAKKSIPQSSIGTIHDDEIFAPNIPHRRKNEINFVQRRGDFSEIHCELRIAIPIAAKWCNSVNKSYSQVEYNFLLRIDSPTGEGTGGEGSEFGFKSMLFARGRSTCDECKLAHEWMHAIGSHFAFDNFTDATWERAYGRKKSRKCEIQFAKNAP